MRFAGRVRGPCLLGISPIFNRQHGSRRHRELVGPEIRYQLHPVARSCRPRDRTPVQPSLSGAVMRAEGRR